MAARELYLLPCGTLALPRSTLVRGSPQTEEELLPVYSALIRTDDGDIVFDTGLDPDGIRDPSALGANAARMLRSFTEQDDLRSRLRDAGTSEDKVAAVVPSHFHFDHIGALRFFTRSKVYVQNAEHRMATHPDLRYTASRKLFDHPLDYQLIEGDTQIVPGVWALATYGHTPGHQSLAFTLPETGTVVLTGDAVYTWENFTTERTSANAYDLQQALESIRKLKAFAAFTEAAIIPSHDPTLWRWAHPFPFCYK
jgi:glyoxylase-like metal-dependent hydrolase (beta-lactamase superfamily II)